MDDVVGDTTSVVDESPGASHSSQSQWWIPAPGDRITLYVPDHIATTNFPLKQYGTVFKPQGVKSKADEFWVDRPNGGVRVIDRSYYDAGVRWVPWVKSHGWERPAADDRARKLEKLERKLRKGRSTHVRKQAMSDE